MKLGILTLVVLIVSFVYQNTQLTEGANQTLISCTKAEPPPQKNSGGNKDT
ncbi:hypothetical protein NIES4071_17650 [Calothrix sp. NIES-4071]|nr:hypothetical protein NIES4071_17650 [Calothrix sp. NIES-4071]BAZ56098.1 hypothetical protein NIES4105_17600 [Calothrix sp. NIES-4105]